MLNSPNPIDNCYFYQMKPIDYCCDRVLEELKKSWDSEKNIALPFDSLLKEFEVPRQRHEFFKSLIKKMEKDGFVYMMDKYDENTDISQFASRSWLTAEGYYFIEHGGYTNLTQKKQREKMLQLLAIWVAAIGTGLAGLYALIQFFQWICSFYCN